jgi:hypothetical protein
VKLFLREPLVLLFSITPTYSSGAEGRQREGPAIKAEWRSKLRRTKAVTSYRTPRTRLWSARACLRLDLRQLAAANSPNTRGGKAWIWRGVENSSAVVRHSRRAGHSDGLGVFLSPALTGGLLSSGAFGDARHQSRLYGSQVCSR